MNTSQWVNDGLAAICDCVQDNFLFGFLFFEIFTNDGAQVLGAMEEEVNGTSSGATDAEDEPGKER